MSDEDRKDKEKCIKCGDTYIESTYIEKFDSMKCNDNCTDGKFPDEHLHKECGECKYVWSSKTNDNQ